jgi:hypothetical protein
MFKSLEARVIAWLVFCTIIGTIIGMEEDLILFLSLFGPIIFIAEDVDKLNKYRADKEIKDLNLNQLKGDDNA